MPATDGGSWVAAGSDGTTPDGMADTSVVLPFGAVVTDGGTDRVETVDAGSGAAIMAACK